MIRQTDGRQKLRTENQIDPRRRRAFSFAWTQGLPCGLSSASQGPAMGRRGKLQRGALLPDHGRTELRGSLACAAQAAGAGLWRRRRGSPRDEGAPG